MNFSQIAVLLSVAAFFGIIVKKINQPILIGFIIAGFLLSTSGFLRGTEVISDLGKVGITLLLFLIGLEMNVRDIRSLGKAALVTGIGQVAITFILALALGLILGLDMLTAGYLGIAVSFSSTIIIVKLLSEKNTLDSLHGKIILGYLLVQDFIAIVILITLASVGGGSVGFYDYAWMLYKMVLLFCSVWILSKRILPSLFEKFIANSQELLFIVSIAWALGISALVAGPLGFSLEIGGFLAGLALSNLPEHLEIASRTRSLRDFFLTLFFLSLGASLKFEGLENLFFPIITFSSLVIIVKPLILISILGLMGFKKRTSFLAGAASPQISEFSLILMTMGVGLGHINNTYLTLTVIVAVVTMTFSSYMILGAEKIYSEVKDFLNIFERKVTYDNKYVVNKNLSDHVVLIGCLRTGPRLVSYFQRKNWKFLIIDFNPNVYKRLIKDKQLVLFGDITDSDILKVANLNKAKLVISTIDNVNDNLMLLEYISRLDKKPQTIFTSGSRTEAIKLYHAGAGYVVVPDIVAGDYIRHLIKSYGLKSNRLTKIGKNHYQRLTFT